MHLNLRTYHLIVVLLAGSMVLTGLAFLTASPLPARATCASGSSVVITNPGATSGGTATVNTTTSAGQMVSGVTKLSAYSTPHTASGLTFMMSHPSVMTIGEARQNGTTWELAWDSRNVPNGQYKLIAVAHYGTVTSLDCSSEPVSLAVNNVATQAPSLTATILPGTWQGPVGSIAPFKVDSVYTDQYGRISHVTPASVNWFSQLGTFLPGAGASAVFTAGGTVGSGAVSAKVTFAGSTATASVPIKVTKLSTVTANTPTTTATTVVTPPPLDPKAATVAGPTPAPLTTAEANRLAAMPSVFRPTAPTNSNPVVNLPTLGCLEKAMGTARFAEVSAGRGQPTAAERALAASCFSGAEAIPVVLAPVAPAHLTEVATTSNVVKVEGVKHQPVEVGGKKLDGLVISGTAAPNSSVFIYVFSDPLVLRATTDSAGKWTYVLENSLQPGDHEVYAVAATDSETFVRTSAVPVKVAAAASVTDGAMVVKPRWSAAQVAFMAGAVMLVILALIVLAVTLRRRTRITNPSAQDETQAQ